MGFGSNGATAVGAANQFVIEKSQRATDKRADYYFNIHFNLHSAAIACGTNSNEKWCAIFTILL